MLTFCILNYLSLSFWDQLIRKNFYEVKQIENWNQNNVQTSFINAIVISVCLIFIYKFIYL